MHNKYVADTVSRLDIFLSSIEELLLSRSMAQKLILCGCVLVNSESVSKLSYKIKHGDIIEIKDHDFDSIHIPEPKDIKLDILYEDEHLIVINKQKGLLVHPTSYNNKDTLVNALLYHCDKLSDIGAPLRPGIVHRLDKDTSGLMLAAKTNEAHTNLSLQIKNKTAIRKYLSFVYGIIDEDFGIINKPLLHHMDKTVKMQISNDNTIGKEAVTHFRVIKRYSDATLVELTLETGRTHQIRVHMASINHPVINDDLYGAKGFKHGRLNNFKTKGHILMSYYLEFTHPITGKILTFTLDRCRYDSDFNKALTFFDSI